MWQQLAREPRRHLTHVPELGWALVLDGVEWKTGAKTWHLKVEPHAYERVSHYMQLSIVPTTVDSCTKWVQIHWKVPDYARKYLLLGSSKQGHCLQTGFILHENQ
ncbi:hypothetical protein LJR129_002785 [Acidovorax sp. LjRoot129]|uniref:hypothetical protein n=1 Tax=Acidovorax sp. LjRoot129 TaxID=3342260 RepID=UPI003ECE0850